MLKSSPITREYRATYFRIKNHVQIRKLQNDVSRLISRSRSTRLFSTADESGRVIQVIAQKQGGKVI